jgi:uncharacterized protein
VTIASILWKKLDGPGHDACRLVRQDEGYKLEGTAVCRIGPKPARLDYALACDRNWLTQWGEVRGWIGDAPIELRVCRAPDTTWLLNGAVALPAGDLIDLDFGLTPASNLLQIRRLDLPTGKTVLAPVAWLDVEAGRLELVEQTYTRRSEGTFWYESPRFDYTALLEIDKAGFVARYPRLWEAVPEG